MPWSAHLAPGHNWRFNADKNAPHFCRLTWALGLIKYNDSPRTGQKQEGTILEPSFMRTRKEEVDYFFLLITIVVGVTIANLLSNFITAKVVTYQAQQAAIEVGRVLQNQAKATQAATREAVQQSIAQQEAAQRVLQQQRASDANGIKLSQSCAEWRRAEANLNSYTTRTEAAKFCNRYDRYVQTGQIDSAP